MDNQNTCSGVATPVGIYVLILVLMDNQNTQLQLRSDLCQVAVLILVLMDNQNTKMQLNLFWRIICLNPCSNG